MFTFYFKLYTFASVLALQSSAAAGKLPRPKINMQDNQPSKVLKQ